MANALLVALYSKLATDTGVGGFMTLLGSRVYLDSAPGDTALPLCVYSASNARYEKGMNGTETQAISVVFTVYETQADITSGPTALARLATLLDGVNLTATGFDRVRCILKQRGGPAFEDEVWSTSDTYELIGQQT